MRDDTRCPRCDNIIEPDLQGNGPFLLCEGGAYPCGHEWESEMTHGYIVGNNKKPNMKLVKILYKNGSLVEFIIKDETSIAMDGHLMLPSGWEQIFKLAHAGGTVWINPKEIAQLDIVNKNIVINSRSTITPSGRIRVRRLRNPLEQEKHYENPCN